MPRFSYIHLSDTHFCVEPLRRSGKHLVQRVLGRQIDTRIQRRELGFLSFAKPASYVPRIAKAAAKFCLERARRMDGIIYTGDLATSGLSTDLNVAYSFVAEKPTSGFTTSAVSGLGLRTFPTLNAANLPIYVLPGNHDKYADLIATPHSKSFELKFGPKPGDPDGAHSFMRRVRSGVGHWIAVKENHHVAFVTADFCLQSRNDATDRVYGVYGQGRVYDHVLKELKKRTLDLRQRFERLPVIWVLHFAPYDCGYDLRLDDFNNVVAAARSLDVTATLCGHTHEPLRHSGGGHIVYCAGSAGCVDSETNSFVHLMHFDVNDRCTVSRETFSWNEEDGEFQFKEAD